VTGDLRIILASASPRRADLLRQLGLSFDVVPSAVPEDVLPGEAPEAHVRRLSREKAQSIQELGPGNLIVAGDTVVVMGERILGKPGDRGEAVSMLMSLSGETHRVVSGLAVAFPSGDVRVGVSTTEVTFRPFQESTARLYVETGEPMDKAGAYGIQGMGSALVEGIHGDYNTVVGLPIPLFLQLLEAGGLRFEFGRLVQTSTMEVP
jgi:septum formation protein